MCVEGGSLGGPNLQPVESDVMSQQMVSELRRLIEQSASV